MRLELSMALLLVGSLSACFGGDSETPDRVANPGATAATAMPTTAATEPPQPTPTPRPTDICLGVASSTDGTVASADPPKGGAGTEVTVTGTRFPAGARVTVSVGAPDTSRGLRDLGEALVALDGTVVIRFRMPEEAARFIVPESPFPPCLAVTLHTVDGRLNASGSFEWAPESPCAEFREVLGAGPPRIDIDPAEGTAGTVVTVAGSGFPAGASVNLITGRPETDAVTEPLASATTDAAGNVTLRFVMTDDVPLSCVGVAVAATDGSATGVAYFEYSVTP